MGIPPFLIFFILFSNLEPATAWVNLFFSNNNNQFFSVDLNSGSFSWENTVNSNLKPTLVGNYLLSVSLEGYLIIIDKITGNIIKVTDVFTRFDPKKRNEILTTGFVVGLKNFYL